MRFSFPLIFNKRTLHPFYKSIKKKKHLILGKKSVLYTINKRQKFIISVVILTLGFFFSEHFLGRMGLIVIFIMSVATDVLLFWSLKEEGTDTNLSYYIFILPFFYSLSFGLFYFLVPARFLTRIITTIFYALGLYSLFLSQNIFSVSSIRTIALLSSARIVSFVLTLVSYFFLANIVFSLHLFIVPTTLLIFICSVLLISHSLWTYTLESTLYPWLFWSLALSLCLFEISLLLWFWPSNPTIIALFLTGFFYTIVGLSHVWLDKRLFRGVLWEYIWVAAIVLGVLIISTSWGS